MSNTNSNATNSPELGAINLMILDPDEWAVKSQTGDSKIYTKITADIDNPVTIRYAINDVANVYTGSDVDPTLYAPVKKGKSLVVGVQYGLKTTLGTGESVIYPLKMHTVIKFPTANAINADVVADGLVSMMSAIFSTFGEDAGTGNIFKEGAPVATAESLAKLMRGAFVIDGTVEE